MQVHYRHDPYFFSRDAIKNSIREATGKATSCFGVDRLPCQGKLADSINRSVYFFGEAKPKSALATFIIFYCRHEFGFSKFMKTELHLPNLFRIFLNTSSPGISLALPDSMSLLLLSTSSAHNLSISSCVGKFAL